MKRSVATVVGAIALAVWSSGPRVAMAQQPAPAESGQPTDPGLEGALRDIEERAKSIRDLRARFVQRKHVSILREPLESSGRVAMKGSVALWETLAPERSIMATDSGSLRIYYPGTWLVEVYDLGPHAERIAGSPIPRIAELKELFKIVRIEPSAAGGPPDDDSLLALDLTPLADPLKGHVERIRVLIDAKIPCATRIVVEDVDGDRTEIEFRNLAINPGVEDSEVRFAPPPGTREIRPLGDPTGPPVTGTGK